MNIDISTLEVKVVDGVKMRVAPLIVRGPERRALAASKPAEVVLSGTFDPTTRTITVTPPEPGDITVVLRTRRGETTTLFTTDQSQPPRRLERRSGLDRRKA